MLIRKTIGGMLRFLKKKRIYLFLLLLFVVVYFFIVPTIYTLIFVAYFWILLIVYYRLEKRLSFLITYLLLCCCPVMIVAEQERLVESLAVLWYLFLCIGVVQAFIESKYKVRNLNFIEGLIKDVSRDLKIYSFNVDVGDILTVKRIKITVLVLLCFSIFLWIGFSIRSSYVYMVDSKATMPVIIEAKYKTKINSDLEMFRISPSNKNILLPEFKNQLWFLFEKGYIRNIAFTTNNIGNIDELRVTIGENTVKYDNSGIIKKWKMKDGMYEMPEAFINNDLFGFGKYLNYVGNIEVTLVSLEANVKYLAVFIFFNAAICVLIIVLFKMDKR